MDITEKANYLLIDSSILPEVYHKVMLAKRLLLSGEAESVSAAVKIAGISRSAYYKYKDKIFEYSAPGEDTWTLHLKLEDSAGVLSSVMSELYLGGANILSVNQSVPVNNVADVSVTVRMDGGAKERQPMIGKIEGINGVLSVTGG